jgi:Bacterial PH domain
MCFACLHHDARVNVGGIRYASIRARGSDNSLYGTYRYMPNWWLSRIGTVVLLVGALAFGVVPSDLATSDRVGAAVTAVGGALFVWSAGGRPRLVVHPGGVTVVNSVRVTSLTWSEIKRFDCQQSLVVIPTTGKWIPVTALPAPGVRRVFSGARGPVDNLAERLNDALDSDHNNATRRQISIATEEGRRDIRTLAAMTTIGTLAIGIARIHLS